MPERPTLTIHIIISAASEKILSVLRKYFFTLFQYLYKGLTLVEKGFE